MSEVLRRVLQRKRGFLNKFLCDVTTRQQGLLRERDLITDDSLLLLMVDMKTLMIILLIFSFCLNIQIVMLAASCMLPGAIIGHCGRSIKNNLFVQGSHCPDHLFRFNPVYFMKFYVLMVRRGTNNPPTNKVRQM